MIGYRDTARAGVHVVSMDRVLLRFGDDGVLWNPSPAAVAAVTATPLRCARFVLVQSAPATAAVGPPLLPSSPSSESASDASAPTREAKA